MADLFQNGEYVMYGTYGVCQITGTTEQQIGENRLLYYVLKPVFQQSSTVFVPLSNRQLTARLHRVLTRAELEQLVDSMPGQQPDPAQTTKPNGVRCSKRFLPKETEST